MIHDHLDNMDRYMPVLPALAKVRTFLASGAAHAQEPGTVDLGDGASCVVAEYETLSPEQCFIECHRRAVDVHVTLEGAEGIGVCPVALCTPDGEYDEEKDYQILKGETSHLAMPPGTFAVFFPSDGHMPRLPGALPGVEPGTRVRKLVFKLPV